MNDQDFVIWALSYAAAIVAQKSAPDDTANRAVLDFHESAYYEADHEEN